IQPGSYANGELIFFGGSDVGADIVDNGVPTSLVVVGGGKLSGNNSYSGKTYFAGRAGDFVQVARAAALPAGSDLDLSGYLSVYLGRQDGSNYQLGTVSIRDGGRLTTECCDGDGGLHVESVLLEEGLLSASLAGDAHVVKLTEGVGAMGQASPAFSGQVDVREGLLIAGDGGNDGFLALGQASVHVGPRGRLALTPALVAIGDSVETPSIELHGGSLFGTHNGFEGKISLSGTLEIVEDSAIYLLDATAARPQAAGLVIDGTIHVAAGKSLTVNGIRGAQALRVTEGFDLGSGSTIGGDGEIGAHLEIVDGAILSPGRIGQTDSIGMLATSTQVFLSDPHQPSATWGEAGRYRWEINDAGGELGAPYGRGWDAFRIGRELIIESTTDAPFIIEPVGLTAAGSAVRVEGLEFDVHYRWLIAEVERINQFSATIHGFDPAKFAVDTSFLEEFYDGVSPEHFWLDVDELGMHLNALLVSPPSADFDGNGVVDADDLRDPVTGWAARFGGDLEGGDFLLWQRQFGARPPLNAGERVPEPPALFCGLILTVLCLLARSLRWYVDDFSSPASRRRIGRSNRASQIVASVGIWLLAAIQTSFAIETHWIAESGDWFAPV
ncbi:MAG: hypothetical protein AAF961_10560, partial [Planctomycetota bacterium]